MTHTPSAAKALTGISRKALLKAKYGFNTAFTLPLAAHEEAVYCDEVVRLIPGKRVVAFGQWNNKPVVAKIFFSRRAKEQMERDLKGTQTLLSAKVPTPGLYYHGKAQEAFVYVLVFERLTAAQSLDDVWQTKKTSPDSEAALRLLTLELATQHVQGLAQEDLHLKNFLLAKDKVYTLDGGTIRVENTPLSKKDSIENLALFFSQLGINTNKLQQRLFKAYVEARSWLLEKGDLKLLHKTIRRWNVQRWLSYRKKIFRSSTQFSRKKTPLRYLLCDRAYLTPDFKLFLKHPDAFLKSPDTLTLKGGRSSTVARVKVGTRHLVVKRYNLKGFWHRLKRCLQPTRAQTSWYIAHQLQFVGIKTAKPVAFFENRFFGLRGKAYFIMEYVEGLRADQFFEQNNRETPESLYIAKKILTLFFSLARLKLSHGDLKITNILLNSDQEPVLLDLDSMREHKSTLSLWHRFRKDMQRLLGNWPNNPALQQLFQKLMVEMTDK